MGSAVYLVLSTFWAMLSIFNGWAVYLVLSSFWAIDVSTRVHGLGWVGLEDFFDPTQKFGLVGLVTQPNPKFFTT